MGSRLVKHARCYWLLPAERHLTQRLFGANRAAAGDAVGARRVADGVVAANLSGKKVEEEGVRDIGCRDKRSFAPVRGVVLLVAFPAFIGYLVSAPRRHPVLASEGLNRTYDEPRSIWPSLWLTALGIVVIGVGDKLVADGATRIVAVFGVSAALMEMVVTPAAIELEEIIRQASRHDGGIPK
jgi:hypothetical protein